MEALAGGQEMGEVVQIKAWNGTLIPLPGFTSRLPVIGKGKNENGGKKRMGPPSKSGDSKKKTSAYN